MAGILVGVLCCLLWKLWQQVSFHLRPYHSHLVIRCRIHRELHIHMKSRELLREKLSLQKLVNEGCLHMSDVGLMLCMMMQMMMIQHPTQVVKKCVIQLMVVVHQLQLLI